MSLTLNVRKLFSLSLLQNKCAFSWSASVSKPGNPSKGDRVVEGGVRGEARGGA